MLGRLLARQLNIYYRRDVNGAYLWAIYNPPIEAGVRVKIISAWAMHDLGVAAPCQWMLDKSGISRALGDTFMLDSGVKSYLYDVARMAPHQGLILHKPDSLRLATPDRAPGAFHMTFGAQVEELRGETVYVG
jgi:hypothetical protein